MSRFWLLVYLWTVGSIFVMMGVFFAFITLRDPELNDVVGWLATLIHFGAGVWVFWMFSQIRRGKWPLMG